MNTSCSSCTPVIPVITQGQSKTLTFNLTIQSTGLPLDVTSATEIIAAFNKTDGTVLEKKLSTSGIVIVNGPVGIINALLTTTDTAGLALGYGDGYQSTTIKIVFPSSTIIKNCPNSFQVEPQQVPIT